MPAILITEDLLLRRSCSFLPRHAFQILAALDSRAYTHGHVEPTVL